MNLTEIVESAGWKNFMAKLYGMGATIVIVGALFKINHWPGGVYFITAGMTVEAIIFFFSSFEPLHEELDWTLVYPELAGMSDPDELENFKADTIGAEERVVERIDQVLAGESAPGGAVASSTGGVAVAGVPSGGISKEAAAAMSSFKVDELPDIDEATKATKSYTENIQKAATAVSGIDEAYSESVKGIKESADSLTTKYFETAETISKSGSEIATIYKDIASSISNGTFTLADGSKQYQENLGKLNDNLQTLNTVYEEQIKDSNERLKGTQQIYAGISDMMVNLKSSVEETGKYKEEMSKLKNSISSLNNVYSNMLNTIEETTKSKTNV